MGRMVFIAGRDDQPAIYCEAGEVNAALEHRANTAAMVAAEQSELNHRGRMHERQKAEAGQAHEQQKAIDGAYYEQQHGRGLSLSRGRGR